MTPAVGIALRRPRRDAHPFEPNRFRLHDPRVSSRAQAPPLPARRQRFA